MPISAFLICSALLSIYPNVSNYEIRMHTCVEVADAASANDIDPILLVSIGWVESGMKPNAVSSAGAIGPLQVIPRYFCPEGKAKGCDTIKAGVRAFKEWKRHFKEDTKVLCHYNAGWRCGPQSRKYAKKVLRIYKAISARLVH